MARKAPNLALRISVTILALLIVVPSLCSARCSSHFCAPTVSQANDTCHQGSIADDSAGLKAASARKPCAPAELVSLAPRRAGASVTTNGWLTFTASLFLSNSLCSAEPSSIDSSGGPPLLADLPSNFAPLRI